MTAINPAQPGYPLGLHTGAFFDTYGNAINALGQFGAASGPNIGGYGTINRQLLAAGVSPGATAADNVLAVYSLPAKALSSNGQGLSIVAKGSFGATANNKTIKIIIGAASAVVGQTIGAGGTTIATTGVVATNGGGWSVSADVYRTASKAQLSVSTSPVGAPASSAIDDTGVILIAITGNAATAVGDIVLNSLEIVGKN